MTFWTDSNRVHFSGTVRPDVLPVAAALHDLAHKQGYSDLVLDFTRCSFLPAALMVPLCSLTRLYRQEKISFEIVMPTQAKLRRLISNSNWAHLIDPEKYDDKSDGNQRNLAANRVQRQ